MKESPEQKLDKILQFCKDRLSTPHTTDDFDKMARDILENNDANVNRTHPYYRAYIDQLQDDGLIKNHSDDGHDKKATLKGLLFEGYVKRKARLRREAFLQILQSWVIAVGTGLTGLYVILKGLLWLHGHYCH